MRCRFPRVLASLQEQSGNKIIDYRAQFGQPADDPELKIQFNKTPFWQALDQVLDQARLTVYPYGDEPGLNVVGRSLGQLLRAQNAVYSGPFRFEPMRLVAQREFERFQSIVIAFNVRSGMGAASKTDRADATVWPISMPWTIAVNR